MYLTLQQIAENNRLKMDKYQRAQFGIVIKEKFGTYSRKVKEKHNGSTVKVNAYPSYLEEEILKAGGFRKKRQRIRRFPLNSE